MKFVMLPTTIIFLLSPKGKLVKYLTSGEFRK